ncbi:aromatic hydrocarbon degradation protein [Photobacterium jeanii]|uniref:Aromatic hydrocarbon degradation protein n=1 Tax=Photobacterium jeanii TaxID=858640 RepID=A0A178KMS1_9GAMM|nr:outer membrane protein transport protein [Photobacterium jeanii]OAN18577.1 aromatic hydrocarbon degradation protein [Photobacterium jeanii]PST91742.1 aromatic hydrocarbon degradation protein [Photobacterium jeanii]
MKKNNITLALAAASTLVISANAAAAGFQLAEYSATGLGRAFAGEAAMADNASAQFRNPAMLSYLTGTQVSTGAIYVDPNIDVKGNLNIGMDIPTEANDIAKSAVIPNFYLSHQINDQVFVGLALSTNYGMETELGGEFLATQYGNQAKVHSVEINPNLAYKINEQFSVGAGVRYVMGEGHFGANTPTDMPTQQGVIPKGTDLKYMEGDDTAWGWQLGAAWQINDDNRIGFNYRSAVDLKLEGEASGVVFDMTAAMSGKQVAKKYSGSMELTLPATAELASFHQLTDKVAVHASFNWTDWSSFDKLEADIDALGKQHIKDENWKDNYRFAVGSTYQLNQAVVLRTGVAYDTSAVDDANRTQTIPETDRLWLSLGAGYQVTKDFNLDAGFTYIFAKDASMTESEAALPGQFTGETTGNVWLLGVQASYRF